MKTLLVLWDPETPLVPVAPVVDALKAASGVRVTALTFGEIDHPTLPNCSFELRPLIGRAEPDGILWIEGGPLPSDLADFPCPKACWLVNTHLESSLLDEIGPMFDRIFTALLRDTADEKARWLPLAASEGELVSAPDGVSLLVDDPRPPLHVETEQTLAAAAVEFGPAAAPVVVSLGNAGQVHPLLFDCLRSGVALVADPETDLRGIARAGDHLEVYPSREGLPGHIRDLLQDPERLSRLASRGPAIIDHLHQPGIRATQIFQGIWPHHRVLSGKGYQPRISVLVTCHRYLRRLRICLESLAHQELPPGSLEIVVADPASPDGLLAHLEEFAGKYSGLRVVHLPLDARYHRNRGVGINRAFDVSAGRVIVGIDGDLVFPPGLIGFLEGCVLKAPERVYGVRRIFLGKDETERILAGEIDPLADFERLSGSEGDGEEKAFVGVLGYCQAVDRKAFARARYPEELDMVNQSDIVFVDRLASEAQVTPQYMNDQAVLHLWHPRNWAGTSAFL